MVSANERTNLRQTTIPIGEELRTIPSLCIHTHRAELI